MRCSPNAEDLGSANEDPDGEFNRRKRDLMKSSVTNFVMALGLVAIGVAIGAAGIYIGDADDAPGAAFIGIVLMIGAVAHGVRTARRKI